MERGDPLTNFDTEPTKNENRADASIEGRVKSNFPSRGLKPRTMILVGESGASQSLGSSLALILQRNPGRISETFSGLTHQFIPKNIRLALWKNSLFNLAQEKLDQVPIRILREQFIDALQAKLPEKLFTDVCKGVNMNDPEHSRALQDVEKSFKSVPVLRMFACREWVENFSRVVSLSSAIAPGLEVSMIFPVYVSNTSEHNWSILDIAFMAQLVRMCGIPNERLLNEICRNIISCLEKWDIEFVKYLRKLEKVKKVFVHSLKGRKKSRKNSRMDVGKEARAKSLDNVAFPMSEEHPGAENTLNIQLADMDNALALETGQKHVEITLANLKQILTKFNESDLLKVPPKPLPKSSKNVSDHDWMSDSFSTKRSNALEELVKSFILSGFVDWLTIQPIMFLWDQLMIGSWKPKLIEQVCVVILALIKHQMNAGQFIEEQLLEDTLKIAGSKLFTKDIVKSLGHFRKGGSLASLPVSGSAKVSGFF